MPTISPPVSSHHVSRNLASRIGTHPRRSDSYADIYAHGARWARFGWACMLDRICSGGPGTFDFENHGQDLIDGSTGAGLSVLAILDGRWGWEADNQNLIPWATPIWEHWEVWEEYVYRTVARYKGRVKYWEMGNEPPFFWFYPEKGGLPHVDGPWKRAPIKYYAEKVRRTAAIIRQLDPEARIVLGSTFPDGQFLRQCYQHGLKDHFDIASVHYLHCHTRERFEDGYENLRAILAEHGDGHKELWDTESGPDGGELSLPAFAAEDYAGLYNIYRHCYAHEFGLQRYFWFPSERGVRSGNEVCASYQALGALHAHVGTGRLLKCGQLESFVRIYVFDGPEGPASVLWATAEGKARFFGELPAACDAFGRRVGLDREWNLQMQPLLVEGDLLDGTLDVAQTGLRFPMVSQPLHKPAPETGEAEVPPAPSDLWANPERWGEIPPLCLPSPAQIRPAHPSFMLPHSTTEAELRLAWDLENLHLLAILKEAVAPDGRPRGIIQFTLRDSAPGEYGEVRRRPPPDIIGADWRALDRGRFFNGCSLISIECASRGNRVLRSECLDSRSYPTGILGTARVAGELQHGHLLVRAAIPLREIGPLSPLENGPHLFMAAFGIADGPLDVPIEADPMDWHQNYQHGFIVRPPAEKHWLFFREAH